MGTYQLTLFDILVLAVIFVIIGAYAAEMFIGGRNDEDRDS